MPSKCITRSLVIVVILSLLSNPLLDISVTAGSVHIEDSDDFENGTMDGTKVLPEGITLGPDLDLLNNWTEMEPETSPHKRSDHSFAFDTESGKAVLFGGGYQMHPSPRVQFNDTWAYDPASNAWTNMSPSVHPDTYNGYDMVYNPEDDEMILFGGAVSSTIVNDTWTYDLNTNTWTNISAQVTNTPLPRSGHQMVYDSVNKNVVMFGGGGQGGSLNETWIYHPATKVWTDVSGGDAPSPRTSHLMAFDPVEAVVVLYGGFAPVYQIFKDTWTFNVSNNTWTELEVTGGLTWRCWGDMVYHPERKDIIFYGGYNNDQPYAKDDTWVLDLNEKTWTNMDPWPRPVARYGHGMVYDPVTKGILMFGGSPNFETTYYNDTWYVAIWKIEFDGTYGSAPIELGGVAYFGTLEWDALLPGGTDARFQVRSSVDLATLGTKPYLGPDGTNGSHYLTSGSQIRDIHNGCRWVQYKIYLNSTVKDVYPVVQSVALSYNLLHEVSIDAPAGYEVVDDVFNISWSASDMDGDDLYFDILLLNDTAQTELATGLTEDHYLWDTNDTTNGTYQIRVVARDDNMSIPLKVNDTSVEFSVHHNVAPKVNLTYPEAGGIVKTPKVTLRWGSYDEDGDPMTYYLYFDDVDGSTFLMSLDETSTVLEGLEDMRTYYWTVVPNDGIVNGTAPAVNNFTLDTNYAPTATLRSPRNGTIVRSNDVVLEWSGLDLESDEINYHVHFDDIDGTSLLATVNTTNYTVTDLVDGKTYFWTIVPFDGRANGTCLSGIWNFTIIVPRPPVASFDVTPTTGNTTTVFTFNSTSIDTDGTIMRWEWDLGDGSVFSGENLTHVFASAGTYTVNLTVIDDSELKAFAVKDIIVEPVLNHPPIIGSHSPGTPLSLVKDEEVTFAVTALDPDEDPLTYEWTVDGEAMTLAQGTSFTFMFEDTGDHVVNVTVSDGKHNVSQTWAVTVEKKRDDVISGTMDLIWAIILVVIIIVVLSIIVGIHMLRNKGKDVEAQAPQQEEAGGTGPLGTGPLGDQGPPLEGKGPVQ